MNLKKIRETCIDDNVKIEDPMIGLAIFYKTSIDDTDEIKLHLRLSPKSIGASSPNVQDLSLRQWCENSEYFKMVLEDLTRFKHSDRYSRLGFDLGYYENARDDVEYFTKQGLLGGINLEENFLGGLKYAIKDGIFYHAGSDTETRAVKNRGMLLYMCLKDTGLIPDERMGRYLF